MLSSSSQETSTFLNLTPEETLLKSKQQEYAYLEQMRNQAKKIEMTLKETLMDIRQLAGSLKGISSSAHVHIVPFFMR
jgi:hypothetical protein